MLSPATPITAFMSPTFLAVGELTTELGHTAYICPGGLAAPAGSAPSLRLVLSSVFVFSNHAPDRAPRGGAWVGKAPLVIGDPVCPVSCAHTVSTLSTCSSLNGSLSPPTPIPGV